MAKKRSLQRTWLFAAAASLFGFHVPLAAQASDELTLELLEQSTRPPAGQESLTDADTVINITLEEDHEEEVALGFDLIKAQKPDEAIPLFERAIASYESDHADQTVYCAGTMEEATMVWLLEADENAPSSATIVGNTWCDAIFGKGFALIDLKQPAEALAYLEKAVRMAPLNAHYANEHAEWYKAARDWRKSYELFNRAFDLSQSGLIEIAPTVVARSLRGMGYNMIELGDLKLAREHFNKSLEVEPNNRIALFELGYIDELESD